MPKRQPEEESEQAKQNIQIAVISNELANIKVSITEIKTLLVEYSQQFVTQEQLTPIKLIVYGGTGAILLAALGGGISIIWRT